MATQKKIENTAEAWEDGRLGRSEQHIAVADKSVEDALDEALGLQSISIRLPKQLIDQFKLIGHFHSVGYQPLMRDVLTRFVPGALNEILDAQVKLSKAAEAKAQLESKPERKAA